MFNSWLKIKRLGKLYMMFYFIVLLNLIKYFIGLFRNIVILLLIKVVDIMLVYSKEKFVVFVKDFEIKLSDKEIVGL